MTNKLFISVSALVLGVTMAGSAMADDTNTGALTGNVACSDSHGNATATSSTTETVGVTDTDSVTVDDSDTLDVSYGNDNTVGSHNTVGSGNSADLTFTDDDTFDLTVEDNDTTTTTVMVSLSLQAMDAVITGNSVSLVAGGAADHPAETATNDLTTGSVSGGTQNAFAGIQTASYNSGLTTANQAATSLGANSDISFGDH